MQPEVRWDGEFGSFADHTLGNGAGSSVPQPLLFKPRREWGTAAPVVAVGQIGLERNDVATA